MTIQTGDCIEVMAAMDADSVDAIVTDPPYGLEFMGKEWDAFRPTTLINRGGKAPGHAGKGNKDGRTPFSRTRVAYGIGSRRSTLVCDGCGKRDKFTNPHDCPDGTGWTRIFLDDDPRHAAYGQSFQAWCEAWGREALRVSKPGGYLLAFGGTRTHHRLVCGLEDAGWIIRDELDWIYASGFPKGKANLKPAHEPIVLARKPGPLQPLAIDECRIGTTVETWPATRNYAVSHREPGGNGVTVETGPAPAGRWPSNLLLSDPALFDEPNPYVVGSGATATSGDLLKSYQRSNTSGWSGPMPAETNFTRDGDSGGYSRFFIVPKADRADREPVLRGQLTPQDVFRGNQPDNPKCLRCNRQRIGALGAEACDCEDPQWAVVGDKQRENAHPTVKPVDLMRHLVRLVTPSGGIVLDPFLGSGSTAIAAELEGFPWLGIEKEPEYVAIAEARLNGTQRGLGLDVPAPTKAQPKTHPDLSKHQPKRRAPSESYSGGGPALNQTPSPHEVGMAPGGA